MRRVELALVLALTMIIAPTMAQAGLRKCNSRSIVITDLRKLRSVARITAANWKMVESSVQVCMNPGLGSAWFDALPEKQPDGSTIHPTISCNRGHRSWKCEVLKNRVATLEIPRNGIRQKYEFTLPVDMALGAAHQLVGKAFEVAPTLRGINACDRKPDDPHLPIDDEVDEDFQRVYGFGYQPKSAEIRDEPDGGKTIIIDSYTITFGVAVGGKAPVPCWAFEIVVA